ncbi:MAG: type IV pilus assembly protein PilM [Candidatus Dadabacteria bacterium]|nr:type IV pilus assembly protein PilM [Candidatus Dadabacteria bacterium]NIT13847.1 type IV pilus assembly protein PilM [Candidatus Dadabacteria bacterium]
MFFSKKDVVGLDIGSSSIKLVELKGGKKGYQLKNLGEALLPPDAIVNKVINNPENVIDSIATLIDDLNIKSKNVAIGVSGHSVIIKKVSMPKMSDKELRESIPWELEQYIPQSVEDVNYDFQILPGETAEGNMEVLIIAAKKDITGGYLNVVTDAGLKPVVVDVDVFALENMYDANYIDSQGVVALVNVGASIINVNILRDGISIFTRDITTGGNQFTEMIQKEADVSYEEAEKMKYTLGTGSATDELKNIANEFNNMICGEIKRTLDFFTNTIWKDKVNVVYMGGGSSKVPEMESTLKSMASTDVELINPFRNIGFSTRDFDSDYINDIGPKMSIATGLAIRKIGDRP